MGLVLGLQKCFPRVMYMSCSWEAIFSTLVRLWESLRDIVLAERWKRELQIVWNGKGVEERYLSFPTHLSTLDYIVISW